MATSRELRSEHIEPATPLRVGIGGRVTMFVAAARKNKLKQDMPRSTSAAGTGNGEEPNMYTRKPGITLI